MNEAQWQQRITDTCDAMKLRWHHETDSRRSKSGFPDLVIVGPMGLMFLELKSETGKVTADQREWMDALQGVHLSAIDGHFLAYVARPSDWDRVLMDLKLIAGRL